jgi:hypothetical protein
MLVFLFLYGCCRTYDISKTPGYFVFEDLALRGYKMPDRKLGLDRQHLQMTLAKLAKWHATTATLHEKVSETIINIKI